MSISPFGFNTKSDQRLLSKAIGDFGYDIPKHRKTQIINECFRCIENDRIEIDSRLAAMRNVLRADELNLKLIEMMTPKHIIHTEAKNLTDEQLDEELKQLLTSLNIHTSKDLLEKIPECQSNEQ